MYTRFTMLFYIYRFGELLYTSYCMRKEESVYKFPSFGSIIFFSLVFLLTYFFRLFGKIFIVMWYKLYNQKFSDFDKYCKITWYNTALGEVIETCHINYYLKCFHPT